MSNTQRSVLPNYSAFFFSWCIAGKELIDMKCATRESFGSLGCKKSINIHILYGFVTPRCAVPPIRQHILVGWGHGRRYRHLVRHGLFNLIDSIGKSVPGFQRTDDDSRFGITRNYEHSIAFASRFRSLNCQAWGLGLYYRDDDDGSNSR